jgi:hypothetical protein
MRFPPKHDERLRRVLCVGKHEAGEWGYINFGTGV